MDYDDFAELYDRQYALYRDDLAFYGDLAAHADGPVLEIGAGSGRVTAFMARRGARVTGVEPSARMLERARARLGGDASRVTLVRGDARTVRLDATFALAVIPFNALMHLYTPEDQLAALTNVRAHLRPGGELALDLSLFGTVPTGVLRHADETFHGPRGRTDVTFVQDRDDARQTLVTRYFVDTTHGDGHVTREHHTLTQRWFTRWELEWLLRHAGFAPPRVHGGFRGEPLMEGSETMVIRTLAV
ncbi:class I SAM-dependent methyltransferase [Deinococcus pimensis]|uniref:class I SAM-dependent methyltransferase n=1 Tax=Deinococcus pimensis TaxID=309888 RepID=UPI000487965C|nr:class I SAM-dependent methyltransferase [Deinococcus pimensis]